MRKFLSNKLFEYQDVLEILSEHLNDVPNIKEFCLKHDLQYNTIILIKKGYTKQYPRMVIKLLRIFGYDVQEITAFKFS
jgi:hypothetical protein